MKSPCPKCNRPALQPIGKPDSKLLIVADIPEDEDLNRGMPFIGKRGEVLEGELTRVGLQLRNARIMYLNPHLPAPDCEQSGFLDILKEMKDRSGVLMMGAGLCEKFELGSVTDSCGLVVHSPFFPKSTGFVMVTTVPPTMDYIGEFRLSIEKLARRLKEVK